MAKKSLSDQMRSLILGSGKSVNSIGKAIDLDAATLNRFLHGKGGMSVEGLDRLAAYLGWELIARPTAAKAAKPQVKSKTKGEGK